MNTVKMQGFTRINKRAARNAYNAGKTIYIQSCNYRPLNMWQSAFPIHKDDPNNDRYVIPENDVFPYPNAGFVKYTFDERVSNFESYNCDHERGYYAAFYIKDGAE